MLFMSRVQFPSCITSHHVSNTSTNSGVYDLSSQLVT